MRPECACRPAPALAAWLFPGGTADSLAFSPAAGIFGMPPAGPGPGRVIEEQSALPPGTLTQPARLESGKFPDNAPGQASSGGFVVPYQVLAKLIIDDRQLGMSAAVPREPVELGYLGRILPKERSGSPRGDLLELPQT